METKVCRACGVEKTHTEFYAHRSAKDGLQSRCKTCACEQARQWSQENRAQANAASKARRDRTRGGPPRPLTRLVDRDGVTLKRCRVCERAKPLDEFHKGHGSGQRQNACKPCAVAAAKRWGKDNPEKFRRNQIKARLKNKYGLTPAMVDELMDKQDGKCAVCRDELAPSSTHIDHCHIEGHVRGLLCRHCNTGLGMFKDDEKRLLAAVKYLRAARRLPAA